MPAKVISLIGMSNVGKSYLARRLAREAGYEHVDCDRLIAQRLFAQAPGTAGVEDLALWLGQPGDARYDERSQRLLAVEREVMQELLRGLETGAGSHRQVIDTSGSVIHAGADVLAALRRQTRVIYLEATPAQSAVLYARYLARPKPLVWAEAWQPQAGETAVATRERCYPALLAMRAARYAGLAHVTVPSDRKDEQLRQLTGARR